ncbi:aminopeptidase N [Arthrobacter sp. HLT1-20]
MLNSNLARSEAAARKSQLSVHHYDVHLDLSQVQDPSVQGFPTRSTIAFSASSSGGTFLDFMGLAVKSVVLNGEKLDLTQVVDGARIHLPALAPENEVTVDAIAAYSTSGEGLHRFVDPADGQTYTYTQFEPSDARRVFANFEQPDLKAPFTFHVVAPSAWQVASNQSVVSQQQATPGGEPTSLWDFAPTAPISTYITTVLAGPYFKVEDHLSMVFGPENSHAGKRLDIPLAAYCRASLAPHFDAAEIFKVTKQGLQYFNELFDYPYPFGKYDQAFVPEYNLGAMENPGLVTFTETYLHASRATDTAYQQRANTIMHEMAHMWFGDLVTMAWWDDLWLKESVADFMGHLAVAEATEWGQKSWTLFASRRKAWAYVQDQFPTTHPIAADIADVEAAKANFDGITYAKGASVLKQLVAYVGQDAFVAGSREYFASHAYSNTSLNDLLKPLSAASGRDLSSWTNDWLQTSGMSTLTPMVTVKDGRVTSFSIAQEAVDPVTGKSALRPHRLAVGFFYHDGATLERGHSFTLDVLGELTEVGAAAGLPAPDMVLLNDQDFSYAKIRFDAGSLTTALASAGAVSDPLSRSLVWSALWNATRDALLPATSYIGAVVAQSGTESDISVLQTLVDNACYALNQYTRPELHAAALELLTSGVVKHLADALPGSDGQLVWARALAVVGRSSDAVVGRIRGLLNGVDVPDGLTLDGDLRWQLWQSLAARGTATMAELDAELAADTTAEFRAAHCTAAAAFPNAEQKNLLWQQMVQGTGLSNELLSATIAGFTMAPSSMLQPFEEPYFDAINHVWTGRSLEIAGRIVRGLYPARQQLTAGTEPGSHPVIQRTDAWLDQHSDAPTGLRRIVLEQRDQLLRSLRVQAL